MSVCGLRENFSLRDYQRLLVDEVLSEFEKKESKTSLFLFPKVLEKL